MNVNTLIQLPGDVKAAGYIEVRPYHYEQVFYSPSLGFKGTEYEFLKAGHAYAYVQVDKFSRLSFI